MSRHRPYHIPNRGTTIATYWLLQWVGIIVLVAGIFALFDDWTLLVHDIVPLVIMGTILAGMIMIAQVAYVAAPGMVGGSREIGRFRLAISITAAAAGVTGLCSLVLWLLIVSMAVIFEMASELDMLYLIGTFVVIGLGAMVALLVMWVHLIRKFLYAGKREVRFAELATRMLVGTGQCALVCAGMGLVGTLVASNGDVFLGVMMFCSPWLLGAAITLLGCRLYLKRLWKFRAPWYESHCPECGYDLSGNLAVTQCSECGTPWTHAVIVPADSRRADGKCDGCGYDMTGIPDADKCPECGTGWRPAPISAPRSSA